MLKTSDEDIPGRTADGGYVYVVTFADGTTKVGSTINPRSRIATHDSNATAFGTRRTDVWISPLHYNHKAVERLLIDLASGLSKTPGSGLGRREYFTGICHVDLVKAAARLPFKPTLDPPAPAPHNDCAACDLVERRPFTALALLHEAAIGDIRLIDRHGVDVTADWAGSGGGPRCRL